MKYIFKGNRDGWGKDMMNLTIKAHSVNEAYKKAAKEAERWHLKLVPKEDGDYVYETKESERRIKRRLPKNPIVIPNHDERQINAVVKQIEIAYRKSSKRIGRLGTISAFRVRETIKKHKIAYLCNYCLKPRFAARYCSPSHRDYYSALTWAFYGTAKPYHHVGTGDSIDHIVPISLGGLEFDRDNLQWMPLSDNIRKGGINVVRAQQRKAIKAQLIIAVLQAQALWQAAGFGQNKLMLN